MQMEIALQSGCLSIDLALAGTTLDAIIGDHGKP